MAWSFDDSLATEKDEVRFRIGDTNSKDELLQNETIQTFLTAGASVLDTSIKCCVAIIAKLARDVDRSNLGMSASRSQKITHYKDLLVELRAEIGLTAAPKWGGTSISDKDTIESDSDYRPSPFFSGWGTNKQ